MVYYNKIFAIDTKKIILARMRMYV